MVTIMKTPKVNLKLRFGVSAEKRRDDNYGYSLWDTTEMRANQRHAKKKRQTKDGTRERGEGVST